MSSESPTNGPKDYEVPCRPLDNVEFDASSGIPPEKLAGVTVGGFERGETILEMTEFDCAPPVALVLTVQLADGIDPGVCSRKLAELLCALSDYDVALGGRGLVLDRARSRSGNGVATLVLLPLEVWSAPDRLRQMAELLRGPYNNAHPGTTTGKTADDLIESVALSVAQPLCLKGDPTTARERVQGWPSGQTVVASIHVEIWSAA